VKREKEKEEEEEEEEIVSSYKTTSQWKNLYQILHSVGDYIELPNTFLH